MDLMTLLGWIVGLGSIGYLLGGEQTIQFFVNPRAMILVVGGSLGGTLLTYPWTILKRTPAALLLFVFPGRRESADSVMTLILTLATRARRTSMESLESDMKGARHQFLMSGLR